MSGVFCPTCGVDKSAVVQTLARAGIILRRRRCSNGHAFPTRETVGGADEWKARERERSRTRRISAHEEVKG